MAHFAQLDADNAVLRVVYVPNDVIALADGTEDEAAGIAYCVHHAGEGPWIQASYNGNMRNRYPAIGDAYRDDLDAFIRPQPYPSWILDLNANDDWIAPVPQPVDDEVSWWEWDEGNLTWVGVYAPQKPKVEVLGE